MLPLVEPITVAGSGGSLRARCFDGALRRAAIERAPEGAERSAVPIADLPFYDPDAGTQAALPASVRPFRDALLAADIVLIDAPEDNGGLPATVEKALDGGGRPVRNRAALHEKPVGIMGTSPGRVRLLLARLAAWAPRLTPSASAV